MKTKFGLITVLYSTNLWTALIGAAVMYLVYKGSESLELTALIGINFMLRIIGKAAQDACKARRGSTVNPDLPPPPPPPSEN